MTSNTISRPTYPSIVATNEMSYPSGQIFLSFLSVSIKALNKVVFHFGSFVDDQSVLVNCILNCIEEACLTGL